LSTNYVFLHGFSGSGAVWHSIVTRLPTGARVLSPNLAGHVDAPPPASFESEVARLAGIIGSSGLREIHLVGYSLGARLALGLLAHGVLGVAQATLIGVHPGLASELERARRVEQDENWALLIEQRGVAAFVEAWESNPIFESQKRAPLAAIELQRRTRSAHAAPALAATMRALSLGRMPNYWSSLGQIAQPIRLLTGALDSKFTQVAQKMLPLLRAGSLQVEPDIGHNVLLERPDSVLRPAD
jgi:2-succinyl-6-hydroxy-2,4-cyclohexadiene-1-carboxylate synthase